MGACRSVDLRTRVFTLFFKSFAFLIVLGLGLPGCAKKKNAALDPDLARFVSAKRIQTKELAQAETNRVPRLVWQFFDEVLRNDWPAATNLSERLNQASGRYANPPTSASSKTALVLEGIRQALGLRQAPLPALRSATWAPIMETIGAYENFHDWDSKWLHRFGRDIIDSIPTNSIYFGGTDPGRFVISVLCESHRDGRPFFTVTQNQFADGTYLVYLQSMYGKRIYIPSEEDSQEAFQNYLSDAQSRLKTGQLKPGENVRIVDGRVQVSGQVAVMEINGLLASVMVERNPGREFYIEESFPLDWMYPHLSPHGLILKLHATPLAELTGEMAHKDQQFWERYVRELIGDWLRRETSVKDVCAFAEKTFLQKDLSGFTGDPGFARNESAQKTFSKCRSAIAGVYAWRADKARTAEEKSRMRREANLAFRQAFALCPYSPEAVYRYAQLLASESRREDALLVAKTALRLTPKEASLQSLVGSLLKAE